jgi:hypothetical protein
MKRQRVDSNHAPKQKIKGTPSRSSAVKNVSNLVQGPLAHAFDLLERNGMIKWTRDGKTLPERVMSVARGPRPRSGFKKLSAVPSGPPPTPPSGGSLQVAQPIVKPIQYANRVSQHPPAVGRGLAAPLYSVGVAMSSPIPPVGWTVHSNVPGHGGNDSIVIEGTDFLAKVGKETSIDSAAGSLLNVHYVNPKTLALPRLSALSALFERFHFEHFEIIYCQAAPSSLGGGMVMYYERDPDDSFPGGLEMRIRSAFGHQGVTTTNYWTSASCVLPSNPGEYFVDSGPENRLVYQGIFRALSEVPATDPAQPGVFMVRYRCRLWQSKIDGDTPSSAFFAASNALPTCTAALPFGTGSTTYATQSSTNFCELLKTTSDSAVLFSPEYPAYWVSFRFQGAAATTASLTLSNLAITPTDQYLGMSAGSGTTEYVYGNLYIVQDPSRTMQTTFMRISLATFTTPTASLVRVVPVQYSVASMIERRLLGKLKKASDTMDELKREIAMLTEEKKSDTSFEEVVLEATTPLAKALDTNRSSQFDEKSSILGNPKGVRIQTEAGWFKRG